MVSGDRSTATLLDLAANYRGSAVGVGTDVQRKAITGLRALAPAMRPDLAAQGDHPDSIMGRIPVRALLAGYHSLDEALTAVVTDPMRSVLVPDPTDRAALHRTNLYSHAVRQMLRWAVDAGWPLLTPVHADSLSGNGAPAGPPGVAPARPMRVVDTGERRRGSTALAAPAGWYRWDIARWPDGPRVEAETLLAWIAQTGTPAGYDERVDAALRRPPVSAETLRHVRDTFATVLGYHRLVGTIDESSFTVDRFWEVLTSYDRLRAWVAWYTDRQSQARGMQGYVPRSVIDVLKAIRTAVSRFYYPFRRRDVYEAWGREVPAGRVAAHQLIRAYRDRVSQLGRAYSSAWEPGSIWEMGVKIWADAGLRTNQLQRAVAYRNALILMTLAYAPVRGKNIVGATVGTGFSTFVRGESGWIARWHQGEVKNASEITRTFDARIGGYLDAWVRDPDKRPRLMSKQTTPGQGVTIGPMFPSKVGKAMQRDSLSELMPRWTHAVSGVAVHPHAVRAGAATAIHRLGGDDATAAAAIGDSVGTMRNHYRRIEREAAVQNAQRLTTALIDAHLDTPGHQFEQRREGLARLLGLSGPQARVLTELVGQEARPDAFRGALAALGHPDVTEAATFWRLLYPDVPWVPPAPANMPSPQLSSRARRRQPA